MAPRVYQIGLGASNTVDLPPMDKKEIWEFRPDRGGRLRDVAGAAEAALEEPNDFPPAKQAMVRGDRVTFAVDANIPRVDEVLAGLVRAIPVDDVERIYILLSGEATQETVTRVESALGEHAIVAVHDATEEEGLGYLAANAAAEPIYLHRLLLDADLVIPVIVARPEGALDPNVMEGGIVPTFADAATQRRLRGETLQAGGDDDREASEAAWLLGIQVLVAVIPTADADVAGVVAGTPTGVRRAAKHAIEASWQRDTSRKASLVFACLDGDDQQQSWANVGRALHVARHLVQPGGTIAVTTRLEESVGPSLRRLAGRDEPDHILQQLSKDKEADALTASLILQLRQEGRILLLSRLEQEQVESLGVGAIDHPEQLIKLVQGHESCAIVRGAQFCGIGIPEESRS